MGSLTPMKSPAVPASPFVICEGGGCAFGFMLRLADGVELGLEMVRGTGDGALHVKAIKPGGAIEAWNRQCVGGPSAGKAVAPGDRIVAVNGASEPEAMLAECQQKQMLRLSVVRGETDCDMPALWAGHTGAGSGLGKGRQSLLAPPGTLASAAPAPPSPVPAMAEREPPRSPCLRADACEFVPAVAATPATPAVPPAVA